MKWGTPSGDALRYTEKAHPKMKGENVFRIAAAYDAGRLDIVEAAFLAHNDSMVASKFEELLAAERTAMAILGGPVQIVAKRVSDNYDPTTKTLTVTWERR